MGAWGQGLLANDAAADLRVFWDTHVAPAMKRDREFWTPERVADCFRYIFRSVYDGGLENPDTAAEILAVGVLFHKSGLSIPAPLKDLIDEAAHRELEPDRLQAWKSPRQRERVLIEFLRTLRIRRRRRRGRTAPRTIPDEVRQMATFARQFDRWVDVALTPRADADFDRLAPEFIRELARFVADRTDTADPKLEARAVQYRLMCLAFCTGWWLKLPPREVLGLIERAAERQGRSPELQIARL